MRALLINPEYHTITEVEYTGDYRNIYTHIGAQCFDMVRINDKDNIFVDDEGLINGVAHKRGMFRVEGRYPVHLAGKGLVLGTIPTEDGPDSGPTDMPIETLKGMITWGFPMRYGNRALFAELTHPIMDPECKTTGRMWDMDTGESFSI